MKRLAWFLMELPLKTGDVFDVSLPEGARPLCVVMDHEQKRVLLRDRGQLEPVVKLALEVRAESPVVKRARRFIVVPEKSPFEVDDCDFVCVFLDPFRHVRVALYEVNVPAPSAVEEVPTSNDLPAVSGEIELSPCRRCHGDGFATCQCIGAEVSP